jgi:hypothetical protein
MAGLKAGVIMRLYWMNRVEIMGKRQRAVNLCIRTIYDENRAVVQSPPRYGKRYLTCILTL